MPWWYTWWHHDCDPANKHGDDGTPWTAFDGVVIILTIIMVIMINDYDDKGNGDDYNNDEDEVTRRHGPTFGMRSNPCTCHLWSNRLIKCH